MNEPALILRMDFENDQQWSTFKDSLQKRIRKDFATDPEFSTFLKFLPPEDIESIDANPPINFIDDPSNEGLELKEVLTKLDVGDTYHIYVADHDSLNSEEMTLLAISTEDASLSFRFTPKEFFSVESNLSLGNVDFEEFILTCDSDGIYRGCDDSEEEQWS